MERRHFSELTEEEIREMAKRMENAAADYGNEIGSGGLSVLGCHDVYTATQIMLFAEWNKSKRILRDWQIQNMEDRF